MKSENKYYGISASSLLGVAFIVLKLTHIINWSWWWVTVPFWGPILIGIFLIMIATLLEKFS